MDCCMLGLPVPHHLLKFAQVHVRCISDAVQPSHPLMLSIFPSIREFSSKSAVHIRWSKYWSFSFSISPCNKYSGLISIKTEWFGRWSQIGRGIEWGDHFLPHKFIKRSFECWAASTKQLLNTGGGHQAPRKAAHSLWKEVGQNIKDKRRNKRVRDGDPSWRGSYEGGEVSKQ